MIQQLFFKTINFFILFRMLHSHPLRMLEFCKMLIYLISFVISLVSKYCSLYVERIHPIKNSLNKIGVVNYKKSTGANI